ncbi:MAG TPA: TIGR02147 family protein [Myxococcota bacterium]|nr:TIGR02147 family protein [Myxococcota bacterium]
MSDAETEDFAANAVTDAGAIERPDVARFTDYRGYLKAMTAYLRATRPGFSFRSFARRAGFASPNYLKLVTDGLRNLAPESVERFARGLGLNKREHELFRMLVLLANARSDEERNAIYSRLRERVVGDEIAQLRDDQFAVYDMWWALVVREMVTLPDFVLDARWIARRLRPRVRVSQAQRALDLLSRLGLVVIGDDGKVSLAEPTISTGPEVTSLGVRNHHRAHLELAARSLDEVERSERNITSLTLRLDREQYAAAVEEIARTRRRLLEIADGAHSSTEGSAEIHQAVFSLFPVTSSAAARRQVGPDGVSLEGEDGDEVEE